MTTTVVKEPQRGEIVGIFLTDYREMRLIGSIRRECVDHIIVLDERHTRHVLLSYMKYYNEIRTHLSLDKDAPVSRTIEPGPDTFFAVRSWAGCITNTLGFDLRQAQRGV